MILLDTHVVVWLALEPKRLSTKAIKAIQRARKEDAGVAICTGTLYEIARGVERGRIQITDSLEIFLGEIASRFRILPISVPIAIRAAQMPASFPGDPIDRIIAATAMVEKIRLVTADDRIRKSEIVATIW
ncbi:MAG TPA: type II toxin-antitoxin system VapC family toxin [Alloacidobacterium sp.]|nr:type II toxin-antitoxin system VapC family toxin [Alloacidobacterium sp.]